MDIKQTLEWKASHDEFSRLYTKRSLLSYFNHIEEGVAVMQYRGASLTAQRAYVLHPFFQDGRILNSTPGEYEWYRTDLPKMDPAAVMFAMEYRHTANASTATIFEQTSTVRKSYYSVVNEMLVADKVQNYKDFLLYHMQHPKFTLLNRYFMAWMDELEITAGEYNAYTAVMHDVQPYNILGCE